MRRRLPPSQKVRLAELLSGAISYSRSKFGELCHMKAVLNSRVALNVGVTGAMWSLGAIRREGYNSNGVVPHPLKAPNGFQTSFSHRFSGLFHIRALCRIGFCCSGSKAS